MLVCMTGNYSHASDVKAAYQPKMALQQITHVI